MASPGARFPRSRQAVIGLWFAIAILALVGLITYQTTAAVIDTTAQVAHTHEVIENLGQERAALAEAVSARRAYALTGDHAMIAEFNDAVQRVNAYGAAVGALTADNVGQQKRLETLGPLVSERLLALASRIERKQGNEDNVAHELEWTRAGAAFDARIFSAVSDMMDEERRLLALRQSRTNESFKNMRIMRAAGAFVSFAVLIFAFGQLRREIARRVQLEQMARESEQSLATTLMSIGDGVISTDTEGRVVRMNRVAERLTGRTASSATGKPVTDVFHVIQGETRAPISNPVEQALRDGVEVVQMDSPLLVQNGGGELPIAHTCSPVRDAKGSVVGAVLVFRDQTEEQLTKKLRETAQRQIILSERMASVGTLAAGVAHEINNPLTYVTANLDLILEELRILSGGSSLGRMKELEDMALEARQGAERIRKIVRGLKTFSRAEEERPEVVDIKSILELSINMAFNEIRHRARLVKDYGEIPLVQVDEARLGQVFINLLVNAAQAIPEGDTAANEIRIVTSTDSAGRAVVEVRDTGRESPRTYSTESSTRSSRRSRSESEPGSVSPFATTSSLGWADRSLRRVKSAAARRFG
jgi:PAS domain S-box-containing protein